MTQPSTIGRGSWRLRSVPQDLADRYRAEGWWTDATLGQMVADGLGSMGQVGFHVRSQVRPWNGTFADVDRAARSLAAELRARGVGPGSLVVFQLPNWVEAGITFWAAAYLGAVVVPIVHFYGAKEVELHRPGHRARRRRHRRPLRPQRLPGGLGGRPGPPPRPAVARRRRHRSGRPAGRGDPVRLPARRRPARRPGRRRPRRAGDRRVHVGHDPRPQGRRALAPHDRLRDPPARPLLPHRRPAADHGGAGRPLHRHAQRLPRAAAAAACRST